MRGAWPNRRALPVGGPPYFVAVGTIEPRKNHLLLLNLPWRQVRAGPRRGRHPQAAA